MNSDLCSGTDDNYDDNDNDSNNDNDVPDNTNPCFCLLDFFSSVRHQLYLQMTLQQAINPRMKGHLFGNILFIITNSKP